MIRREIFARTIGDKDYWRQSESPSSSDRVLLITRVGYNALSTTSKSPIVSVYGWVEV
ncbi:hypothetical protein J6590_053016 [Homalodisca vitripennis]|nr:hypothetical protein J6590_053016 [Homalodisca vitripennis]